MKKQIVAFCVAAFATCICAGDNGVYNLREYLANKGIDVAGLVDNESQHVAGYGPEHAFDGFCTDQDFESQQAAQNNSWFGDIVNAETYLKIMLPEGWTCEIDSYRLWRAFVLNGMRDQAPTAWELWGFTFEGDEVLISKVEQHTTLQSQIDTAIDVSSDEAVTGMRFVGFKWVPTSSGVKEKGLNWGGDVGLLELELFVKNIDAGENSVNLFEYFSEFGVQSLVDGISQHQSNYPPINAFDGLRTLHDFASLQEAQDNAWFGDQDGNGTYLKFMLPYGCSCEVTAYRLWRAIVVNASVSVHQAPTGWEFWGITQTGEEMLISEKSECQTLQSKYSMTVDVSTQENVAGERFIGFKWVPKTSKVTELGQNWGGEFGLQELEIFVKNISSGPINIRNYLVDRGFDLADYVSGGIPKEGWETNKNFVAQYQPGCPPINAFDGICRSSEYFLRWMGEIKFNAYLELRLPDGYECDINSYRLWPLNVSSWEGSPLNDLLDRAPTAWKFYGYTKRGDEILLSDITTNGVENVENVVIPVNVPPELCGARFIGFKWVPENTIGYTKFHNGYDFPTGLMELEIFSNQVLAPEDKPKSTIIVVR